MRRNYKRNNKKHHKTRSIVMTTLLVGVAFLLGLWTERADYSYQWIETSISEMTSRIRTFGSYVFNEPERESLAEFHFFDVGQGSSTLLKASDGTTILMDTGRYDDSEAQIINYLNGEIGVGGEIDLLIFTHNDADHIGNGDLVLEYFQVKEVWMNGMDHTSQEYGELLDAMLKADITYAEPKTGYASDIGPFSIEVLHPLENEKQNSQNDESIVTRIAVGETSLVHSGDVDAGVEKRILKESPKSLQSDIMILGHHGSGSSTSEEWLNAVDPGIAVYQAGSGNRYGHPHKEIIKKIADHRAELFGTDRDGTIRIHVKEDRQHDVFTEEDE
ncbi:MAG: MBL fold metallo-hydrolase [Alkalibacterium sp.]|nr:MBL fold metallo-hydrolase [Alkalibacterium sp.]